jgi:hypothetical protein
LSYGISPDHNWPSDNQCWRCYWFTSDKRHGTSFHKACGGSLTGYYSPSWLDFYLTVSMKIKRNGTVAIRRRSNCKNQPKGNLATFFRANADHICNMKGFKKK